MEEHENKTPEDGKDGQGKKLAGRKIFFTLLLLAVVLTMYIGTYYKIVNYGP